jgi:hypothetical protein
MAVRSFARSVEGYALALLGAVAGGVAGGYASGWVLERTRRGTRGIEDIAEGFADLGTISVGGFLGASVRCYALLRLRRHRAAGPTAGTLLAVTLTSSVLVLLLRGSYDSLSVVALWAVVLLAAPLLARAVGERVIRDPRQEEGR